MNAALLFSSFLLATPQVQHWEASRDVPRFRVEPGIRIGSPDGETDAFVEVTSIVVTPRDQIVVLDRRSSAVRIFDQSGRFLRVVGREGRGPGEFLGAQVVGLIGDRVWVMDFALDRVTVFNSEWSVEATYRSPNAERARLYSLLTDTLALGLEVAASPVDSPTLYLVHLPDGPVEPLQKLNWARRTVILDHPDGARWGRFFLLEPFGSWDLFGATSLGSAWILTRPIADGGTSAVAEVRLLSGSGVRAAWRVQMPAVAIPADTIDAVIKRLVNTGVPRQFPRPVLSPSYVRARIQIPRFYPSVLDAIPLSDGGLLLQSVLGRSKGTQVWVAVDSAGRVRWTVDIPTEYKPLCVKEDRIWTRYIDDAGVQYVIGLHMLLWRGGP